MKAFDIAGCGGWRLVSLCCTLVFAAALVLFAQSRAPAQKQGGQNQAGQNQPPGQAGQNQSGQAGQNQPSQAVPQADQATNPFTPQVTNTAPIIPDPPVFADQSDPAMVRLMRRQATLRNAKRQKDLVRDTQKLYDLAGQLKDDVAKTNKDILSIDVIKKADEIEKLAKSVKDKMKGQ